MIFITLFSILMIQLVQINEGIATTQIRANFSTYARRLGFGTEEYDVVTEDGYILTLFRIPGIKKPVLLVHGLLDSGDTFIIRGNGSLAVALANKGYDVWSANARGGRYARRHIKLNPDTDKDYWNFSFHEIGYFDLPAIIDFLLSKTSKNRLSAIGHSQGNSVFYVLCSTRPEYNSKISLMIALSPVCYFNYTKPPVTMVLESIPFLSNFFMSIGEEEFFGDNSLPRFIWDSICVCKECYQLCARGLFLPISGDDANEFEPDFFPTFVKHYPAGSSIKTVLHLAQGYLKSFSMYDYGPQNMQIYGQSSPPLYDLRKVSMKSVLLVGKNDALSTVKDIELLRDHLSNVEYQVLDHKKLNHIDVIWGRNMYKYLFPYIFNALSNND